MRKVGTNEKKLLRYVQAVIMVILAVSLNKNILHYLTEQPVVHEVGISTLLDHQDVIKV